MRSGGHRLGVFQRHGRFLLDETPPRWNDRVWLCWYADDGYMLERYRPQDETLQELQSVAGTPSSPA